MQYRIRRARLEDLECIFAIELVSFGREAYDRKLFAGYLKKYGELFLVAEAGGKVCGYIITCMWAVASGARAELVSIAVDPLRRHRGAASALLHSTLRRLRRRGVVWLRLMVRVDNVAACAFYEKEGFRRDRKVRGYYEDGGDGVRMKRPVVLRGE